MTRIIAVLFVCAGALGLLWAAHAQNDSPVAHSYLYEVRYDRWSAADERAYGEFIQAIGESGCSTVNSCLHGAWNPFASSDPPGVRFFSDCAELPYVLRAYFAWKHGLPFSYESEMSPRGRSRDMRYSRSGNQVVARHDVLTNSVTGYELLTEVRGAVNTASFRIHPDLETPYQSDTYSPAIDPKNIRPGTMVYDPNGHVATIFRVYPNGRLEYFDAHPDESVTRGFFDERFVRARPAMGAGFKNWRPIRLVGYTRRSDGVLLGGHVVLAANKDLRGFSAEQYYGNGPRPDSDAEWASGDFTLNGETLDYYDYVRAKMAGGSLQFDPIQEVRDMVVSNCNDLHYRADSVNVALAAGINRQPHPDRLPPNIYGTSGLWETYSTPSRDARLKTAFKELREQVERFVTFYRNRDPRLVYKGADLVGDLLAAYTSETDACKLTYARSDGSPVTLGYEEMRRRLFMMSFDPYDCAELRWGASNPDEMATCRESADKRAWYAAEQNLRNQLDRTYEARMDYTRDELLEEGSGKGVAYPPDIDVRAYLLSLKPQTVADTAPADTAD
jgi:hypothetical protein